MEMGKLKVGFEQRRGLFMTVGDEVGFRRESINWTQLHMLKQCEVPGLLPIENEELDGIVSFRFNLGGYRMLGEELRVAKWTMSDFMNALCRLAEVLEDCRLYLLDADRILLSDEFIFVGGDWQDIRFMYLPVNEFASISTDTLERLIVRWMMRVDSLDGDAMQRLLSIVAAPDFAPHALRGYIRDYFATASGTLREGKTHMPPLSAMTNEQIEAKEEKREKSEKPEKPEKSIQEPAKPSGRAWRLLQPPSGDPHALSELLGEDRLAGEHRKEERPPMDPHRRRTLLGAAAAVVVAIAWRYGYMEHPGRSGLLLALGSTVIALACVIGFWKGTTVRAGDTRRPAAGSSGSIDGMPHWDEQYPDSGVAPRFQIQISESNMPALEQPASRPYAPPEETTWLPSSQADRTEALAVSRREPEGSCYLLWETKGDGCRVSLGQESVVIGRSAEAAHHVDETHGISRAHVEVIRIAEQWKVKDLGSRNGSKLNEVPMTPYELYPLLPGDRLVLATSKYRFVQEPA